MGIQGNWRKLLPYMRVSGAQLTLQAQARRAQYGEVKPLDHTGRSQMEGDKKISECKGKMHLLGELRGMWQVCGILNNRTVCS